MYDIDLINRDPSGLNSHIQIEFEDILGNYNHLV